jgi:hypothetical protein
LKIAQGLLGEPYGTLTDGEDAGGNGGFASGPLPGLDGLLKERSENRSGLAELLRLGQSRPNLSQDLVLAEDHRVEPAGNFEEMTDGFPAREMVDVLPGFLIIPGKLAEQVACPLAGRQIVWRNEVDFEPVAGA